MSLPLSKIVRLKKMQVVKGRIAGGGLFTGGDNAMGHRPVRGIAVHCHAVIEDRMISFAG